MEEIESVTHVRFSLLAVSDILGVDGKVVEGQNVRGVDLLRKASRVENVGRARVLGQNVNHFSGRRELFLGLRSLNHAQSAMQFRNEDVRAGEAEGFRLSPILLGQQLLVRSTALDFFDGETVKVLHRVSPRARQGEGNGLQAEDGGVVDPDLHVLHLFGGGRSRSDVDPFPPDGIVVRVHGRKNLSAGERRGRRRRRRRHLLSM